MLMCLVATAFLPSDAGIVSKQLQRLFIGSLV